MQEFIFEKDYPFDCCHVCGGSLIAKTICDPKNDTPEGISFCDGDEVFCTDCDFKACVSIDHENGEVWIQD